MLRAYETLNPALSCKRNAELELEKRASRPITKGYAYVNGFVLLAGGTDMLRLEAVATGGNTHQSGNLSFTKRTLVECMSER
jgi:hypothetical protein